jgi:hypothetical protein
VLECCSKVKHYFFVHLMNYLLYFMYTESMEKKKKISDRSYMHYPPMKSKEWKLWIALPDVHQSPVHLRTNGIPCTKGNSWYWLSENKTVACNFDGKCRRTRVIASLSLHWRIRHGRACHAFKLQYCSLQGGMDLFKRDCSCFKFINTPSSARNRNRAIYKFCLHLNALPIHTHSWLGITQD